MEEGKAALGELKWPQLVMELLFPVTAFTLLATLMVISHC